MISTDVNCTRIGCTIHRKTPLNPANCKTSQSTDTAENGHSLLDNLHHILVIKDMLLAHLLWIVFD